MTRDVSLPLDIGAMLEPTCWKVEVWMKEEKWSRSGSIQMWTGFCMEIVVVAALKGDDPAREY
jgi:hypothetical protein